VRVMGVDPGMTRCGLSVVESGRGRRIVARDSTGCARDGDVAALTRVPGIGMRGAERLVLELRDKMGAVPASTTVNGHSVRGPVVEALVGLGFAAKQAEEATAKVLAGDDGATTSSALRSALSLLGKTK
jgi:holliday junction DNA helicase RuvA